VGAIVFVVEFALHEYLHDKAFDVFPEDDQDRERHCWVNCVSTQVHSMNPVPAIVASILKEIQDLILRKDPLREVIEDSAKDLVADFYGQGAALAVFSSCEQQCRGCPFRRH
jgi:hypothetical protein